MAQQKNKAWSTGICLLAALALLLSLCAMSACDRKEELQNGDEGVSESRLPTYDEKKHGREGAIYFEGTVLEIQESFVLIAPIEGKSEGMQQDRVLVNTTTMDGTTYEGFTVGETVGVLCAPMVTMSLPAQVPSVYGFFKAQ